MMDARSMSGGHGSTNIIFAHFPAAHPVTSPPSGGEVGLSPDLIRGEPGEGASPQEDQQVPLTVSKSAVRWAGTAAARRFATAIGRAMLILFSIALSSAIVAMLADAPNIALVFIGSALTAGLTLILTNIVEEKLS